MLLPSSLQEIKRTGDLCLQKQKSSYPPILLFALSAAGEKRREDAPALNVKRRKRS
jgi:hypothetical protein